MAVLKIIIPYGVAAYKEKEEKNPGTFAEEKQESSYIRGRKWEFRYIQGGKMKIWLHPIL